MTGKRAFLIWWIGGLGAFAMTVWLSSALVIADVPGGILDHQSAGDAAGIDVIQHAWRDSGLIGRALVSMAADLIFIGTYGIGCVLGGRYFRQAGGRFLQGLGLAIAWAGTLFLLSDYGETIAQAIQLYRFAGDDTLAGLAALLQPVKALSFVFTFVAVLAALALERLRHRKA